MNIALLGLFVLGAGYFVFVAMRVGLHQRLPLAVGPMSLERIPDRAAAMHGERALFTCDNAPEWSVSALDERYPSGTEWSAVRIQRTAGYLATLFHTLGVQKGDRVAILKRNHFDMHLLTLGVVRCGGVSCPMNGGFDAQKVQPYLDNIGARVLVTDGQTLRRVLAAGGKLGAVETVVLCERRVEFDVSQRGLPADVRVVFLQDALADVTVEMPAEPRASDDVMYLVHSSGTTGFPKAVILTNGAQSHAVRGWLSYVHLSRSYDRGLLAVPNNHQAVILSFNSALLLGLPIHWASACAREDFDASKTVATLVKGRFTGFFAFPIAYTLMKELNLGDHDLSAMRFWASTADAAHAAIEQVFVQHGSAFRSLGLPLRGSIYLDAQGSSEVGTPSVLRYLTAYTRRFDRRIGRPGSTPFGPSVRIAVNGRRVPRGQVGRLEVRGKTVTPGYWNNVPMTEAALCDGWFFTGDVARQERDGHIVQLDREVDVIHTARGPVYSLLIEERLHQHPALFDVCVYGARQSDGTQAPAAAVALRPDSQEAHATLWQQLNAMLSPQQQLTRVDVMDWSEFPIGITGKTLKRVFRERTEAAPVPEANRPVRSGYSNSTPVSSALVRHSSRLSSASRD